MSFCFNNTGNRSEKAQRRQNTRYIQRTIPLPGPPGPRGVPGPQGTTGPANGLNAYGSVYHTGTATLNVTVPGETMSIPFSNNALLSGLTHETGTTEVVVEEGGDYAIRFTLYFTATADAFATFFLQANEESLPGGIYSKMLTTGYQVFSGSTMAALVAGDKIRIAFTSSMALGITLTGNDVTAVLSIEKMSP